MPKAAIIGRIAVKVLPDTTDFRKDLKAKLDAIEKRTKLQIKAEIDELALRRNLLDAIRRLNADTRTRDAYKVKLFTDVDLSRVRQEVRRLGSIPIKLELDPDNLKKVKEQIEHWRRSIDPISIKVKLDLSQPSFQLAALRLSILSRPRTVNLFPKVSKTAAAKAALALSVLSGGRLLGRFFQDFSEWLGNLDKAVPKIAALAAGLVTLASWGLTAAANLAALSSSLASIAPAALALPGILAGFGVGLAITISSLKDLKKALPDVAKQFARIRHTITKNFWDNASRGIRELVAVYLPQLADTAKAVGAFWGELAHRLSIPFHTALGAMFDKLNKSIAITTRNSAVFASIITQLGLKGSQFLPRLARWFNRITAQFDEFLKRSISDQSFDRWIDNAISAMHELGQVIKSVYDIFHGINAAAKLAGGSTLGVFGKTLRQIADVVNSPGFSTALVSAFEGAFAAMHNIAVEAGPAVKNLFAQLASSLATLGPIIGNTVGTLVRALANLLANNNVQQSITTFFLGVKVAVDALAPVIENLATPISGLITLLGNFLARVGPLFGDALGAISPLFNTLLDGATSLIDVLVPALDNLIGFLAPIAQMVSDALAPLAKQIGPALGHALQGLGPIIAGLVRSFAPVVKELFPILQDAFKQLVPVVAELARAFADFVRPLVKALAPVLRAILPPLIKLAKVLADGLAQYLPVIGDAVAKLAVALAPLVGIFLDLLSEVLKPVLPLIAELVKVLLPPLTDLINLIVEALKPVMPILRPLARLLGYTLFPQLRVLALIVKVLGPVIEGIVWLFREFGKLLVWLGKIVAVTLGPIFKIVSKVYRLMVLPFKLAWDAISGLFKDIYKKLVGPVKYAVKVVGHAIGAFYDKITGPFRKAWKWVVDLCGNVWTAIKGAIEKAWQQALDVLKDAWNFIKDGFKVAWKAVVDGAKAVWNGIKAGVTATWAAIKAPFQKAWDWITTGFKAVWDGMLGATRGFINGLTNVISSAFGSGDGGAIFAPIRAATTKLAQETVRNTGAAIGSITTLVTVFIQQMRSLGSKVFDIGATVLRDFTRGAQAGKEQAKGDLRRILYEFVVIFQSLGSKLFNIGLSIMGAFAAGLDAGQEDVRQSLGGLTNRIPKWKGPEQRDKKLLTPAGKLIINSLIVGMSSQYASVRKTLTGMTSDIGVSMGQSLADGLESKYGSVQQSLSRLSGSAGSVGIALQGIPAAARGAGAAGNTLNYYAAPGSSLGSEEDLFAAVGRARAGW